MRGLIIKPAHTNRTYIYLKRHIASTQQDKPMNE